MGAEILGFFFHLQPVASGDKNKFGGCSYLSVFFSSSAARKTSVEVQENLKRSLSKQNNGVFFFREFLEPRPHSSVTFRRLKISSSLL